jgi:hypothetical protein
MERLDVTTLSEACLRWLYYLLIAGTSGCIFMATVGFLQGDAKVAEPLFLLAICGPLTLLAGWVAALVDDTYWVDFPRRMVFFQRRGLLKVRLDVVKSFDELAAVTVDYRLGIPPLAWHDMLGRRRSPRHLYALALVGKDGAIIRVSDPCVDGYPEISSKAADLSRRMGVALLDQGPERSPVVQGGYVYHQDQGAISSGYALLGLLLMAICVVLSLTGH